MIVTDIKLIRVNLWAGRTQRSSPAMMLNCERANFYHPYHDLPISFTQELIYEEKPLLLTEESLIEKSA